MIYKYFSKFIRYTPNFVASCQYLDLYDSVKNPVPRALGIKVKKDFPLTLSLPLPHQGGGNYKVTLWQDRLPDNCHIENRRF